MNYINRLQAENADLKNTLAEIRDELAGLHRYYSSEKFHGFDCDYAYVSTDVLPRLEIIHRILLHANF